MFDIEERETYISTSDVDDKCNVWKIYIHTNRINNKKYIGMTKQKNNRRWRNGEGYKGCIRFYSAIQKYGWDNFDHEVIYDNISFEEACIIEEQLIDELNTTDKMYGYNLQKGGMFGNKHSEETKKILSVRFSGENHPNYGKKMSKKTRDKIREANSGDKSYNYGKHPSEETRRKMSEARKGKKLSEETKRKLSDSHMGKKFSDSHKQNMSKSKTGEKRTEETKKKMSDAQIARYEKEDTIRGGWTFDEDTKAKISKLRRDSARKILCVTTGEVFNSMTDACEKYNLDSGGICKCCKGNRKTCGGMEWSYYDDKAVHVEMEDDKVIGAEFHVNLNKISIKKAITSKRTYTDEERAAIAERLSNSRKEKCDEESIG